MSKPQIRTITFWLYLTFGFSVGAVSAADPAVPGLARVIAIPAAVGICYLIFQSQLAVIRNLYRRERKTQAPEDQPASTSVFRTAREAFSLRGGLSDRSPAMTFLFVGSVIVALSFVRAVAQGLHLPLIDLLINGLIGVFVGVVVISAGFQRMHDRGRSGWWLLVFFGPTTLVLFAMGRLIDMRAPENAITLTFLIGMTFAAPTFIWGICETVLLPPKPSAPKDAISVEKNVNGPRQ